MLVIQLEAQDHGIQHYLGMQPACRETVVTRTSQGSAMVVSLRRVRTVGT